MERDQILEMLFNLEQAWDTLYALDKSENRTRFREERVRLVSTQMALCEEFGITSIDMMKYNVLRRSGVIRHTAIHTEG